ncbi:flippase [Yoonia sp. R78084]|uniref:flippase n=1 Tax=Yoonia sp. R78084 TaxID=3093869 RepID=UPI0037DD4B7D
MSLIPAFIRRRISHRPSLIRIAENISWLFFDKVLRMSVGLFVGIWIARYLGPEQFGILSYAMAFSGLFGALAALGLNGVVVRDIVRDPANASLTLGSAAVLQLIGGLVSFLIMLAAISILRADDPLARSIVAILGAMMLLKASEVAAYWFESQVLSKYTVWVQSSAFIIFSLVKVYLILAQAPLLTFAWAMLVEAIVVAVVLLTVLSRNGVALSSLSASTQRARSLLADSWPLAISAIAITVYMKIDQIMLGQMIGDEAVGIYSAAVQISVLWYFVPVAISNSVLPSLIESRQRSVVQYNERLKKLYELVVVLSFAVAIPFTFLATPIIHLLFGAAYAGAGAVLAIHIWASVFVSLGVASNHWFLAENRPMLNLQRTILGALVNVALNLWLIPLYGMTGAAIATVFSQATAAWLYDALHPATRAMFLVKTAAMNPFRMLKKQSHRGD